MLDELRFLLRDGRTTASGVITAHAPAGGAPSESRRHDGFLAELDIGAGRWC